MARFKRGGGGGGGGGDGGDGGGLIPDSLSDLLPNDVAATLTTFGKAPQAFIRRVIYSELLRGIARVVFPLFGALSLVFLGSNPDSFAAYNEIHGVHGAVLGLLDVPAYVAQIIAGALGGLITTYFDALGTLVTATTPEVPGPIDGIIATAVTAVIMVIVIETLRRLSLATLEAIPVIGGFVKTLITGK